MGEVELGLGEKNKLVSWWADVGGLEPLNEAIHYIIPFLFHFLLLSNIFDVFNT